MTGYQKQTYANTVGGILWILPSRGSTRLRLSEFVQISEFFQFYTQSVILHASLILHTSEVFPHGAKFYT